MNRDHILDFRSPKNSAKEPRIRQKRFDSLIFDFFSQIQKPRKKFTNLKNIGTATTAVP